MRGSGRAGTTAECRSAVEAHGTVDGFRVMALLSPVSFRRRWDHGGHPPPLADAVATH